MGTLLVQLLKRAGARQVIAAASSSAERRHTIGVGADAAVDYTDLIALRQRCLMIGDAAPRSRGPDPHT